MIGTSHLVSVVCYINGVRIDPISVTVSAQAGGQLTFTVNVVPIPDWVDLPPRSHVAVFFKDPVTAEWRLLCEGDYIARSRGGVSVGQWTMVLHCIGVVHAFESNAFANVASLLTSSSWLPQVSTALATGVAFAADKSLGLSTLTDLVTQLTSNPNAKLSSFFRDFLALVTDQLPVESFYVHARKVLDKVRALDDEQITNAIKSQIFQNMILHGVNVGGFGWNTQIGAIMSWYEQMMFYSHCPVIAPPLNVKDGSARIPELVYLPNLYGTIPPAANVVFRDQLISVSDMRLFQQIPTRVIGTLSMAGRDTPAYYMFNGTTDTQNMKELAEKTKANGAGVLTHGAFSNEELERGVRPHFFDFPVEKLVISNQGDGVSPEDMQRYVNHTVQYQYNMSRAQQLTMSVACALQPYLLVGHPILIEHPTGPVLGMLEAVSHTLTQDAECQTSLSVSLVEDVYVTPGKNRSPALPVWLNDKFWPFTIEQTLTDLYGRNFEVARRAAMAPPGVKAASPGKDFVPDHINLFELASQVVPAPVMLETGVSKTENTVAERLRSSTSDPLSFLRFQYRPGVTLAGYAQFHNLKIPEGAELPDELVESAEAQQVGHALFAAPSGLEFVPGGNGQYGRYKAIGDPALSLHRQQVARRIRARLLRGGTAL